MTIRDELLAWLWEQEPWQQDLARRLVMRPQLEGEEWDGALAMVRGAFGAADESPPPEPTPLTAEDLPELLDSADAPRLLAFGRMRGVGAASSAYELRFEPDGLTIIYGQNAAGKTTYVRGLKRVCRTVDCDAAILGNVFSAGGEEKPAAMVEYRIDGEVKAQQVDLAARADLGLQAISVFDARCAELYVDSRNAVAYVPSALLLLARLAATQDRMRAALHAEAERLATELPAFPEFLVPSRPKSLLDSLSATSQLEEIRALATLSDEERERLAEVRAVASSPNAAQEAQAAEHDVAQAESLAGEVEAIGDVVSDDSAAALATATRNLAAAQEAVALAAKEFDELPLPGVGSDPWRNLWEAARRFVETSARDFPPQAGGRCPFCLETISVETEARLQHFEEHIRSVVQATARDAAEHLANAMNGLDLSRVARCRGPLLASLQEREPELHAALDTFLEAASARMQRMRDDPVVASEGVAPEIPTAALREWSAARAARGRTLRAASDPEQQARLQQELIDLEARLLLEPRLEDIEKVVRIQRRIAALRRAYSALATNRITTTQRRLSETAITAGLNAKLVTELKSLRCEHLPIDLKPHTAVGEMQLALQFAGAQGNPQVSDIASEGEQRALSLAFFLAEVATSETNGGIIVDDPVSSLDDERREYIAKRLADEARQRQVIVFTHDLPFMLDLMDQVGDECPLSIQAVWRLGAEIGRVDDHPPFKAMKLRGRVGALEQQVAQWDSQPPPADFDEAWRRICEFYTRMRTAWERAVEERLFRGVVQRFQREVKTLALDDVVITAELVAAVKEGMTRCSMFVHDEPPAASVSLPGRTQLAEDLTKLRDFEKETRL
jgi:energy-coupling factor transporter ATP-binding protein EcfA2